MKITSLATYPLPGIPAFHDGKVVRLIATGDQEGSSPVMQFVDDEGHVSWAKQGEFTVIDRPSQSLARLGSK